MSAFTYSFNTDTGPIPDSGPCTTKDRQNWLAWAKSRVGVGLSLGASIWRMNGVSQAWSSAERMSQVGSQQSLEFSLARKLL
jgi:hypothetical protein